MKNLAAVLVGLLGIIGLLVSCSSGEAAEGDLEPTEVPTGTPVPPTPTTQPLPTPTPAIPDSGQGPIIIGALMASTGVMDQRDGPALEAIRVEVDRINGGGGLLGRDLELVEIDTTSRRSATQTGAEELMRRGVDLLIVTCDLAFAQPAIEIAQEFGVLTVTPCGADEQWGEIGPLVFSLGVSAAHEGRELASWAVDNGYSSTAVLLDKTNPEVEDFCSAFESAFTNLGGSITFFDSFTFDSLDPFEDRLKERPRSMESVLLCTHAPGGTSGAPDVIRLVREEGITVPFLGSSALDGPNWLKLVPVLGDLFVVTPSSIWGDDPEDSIRILTSTINEGELIPLARGWSAHGADAIRAYEIAVNRSGSVDGRSVGLTLEGFSNEVLLSGPVSLSPQLRMDPDRPVRIIHVTDDGGRLVTVR